VGNKIAIVKTISSFDVVARARLAVREPLVRDMLVLMNISNNKKETLGSVATAIFYRLQEMS
jgi:hypothetical protein